MLTDMSICLEAVCYMLQTRVIEFALVISLISVLVDRFDIISGISETGCFITITHMEAITAAFPIFIAGENDKYISDSEKKHSQHVSRTRKSVAAHFSPSSSPVLLLGEEKKEAEMESSSEGVELQAGLDMDDGNGLEIYNCLHIHRYTCILSGISLCRRIAVVFLFLLYHTGVIIIPFLLSIHANLSQFNSFGCGYLDIAAPHILSVCVAFTAGNVSPIMHCSV